MNRASKAFRVSVRRNLLAVSRGAPRETLGVIDNRNRSDDERFSASYALMPVYVNHVYHSLRNPFGGERETMKRLRGLASSRTVWCRDFSVRSTPGQVCLRRDP